MKILSEEKQHESEISAYVPQTIFNQAMTHFSRWGGYILGGFFSAIPSHLNWKIHAWAELEAARIYGKAARVASRERTDKTLVEILRHSEKQETEHSKEFEKLRFDSGH